MSTSVSVHMCAEPPPASFRVICLTVLEVLMMMMMMTYCRLCCYTVYVSIYAALHTLMLMLIIPP